MAWVATSDDLSDHPKVIAAGLLAELLWRRALEWSNRNLTDGFIPHGIVRRLADWHGIGELHTEGRLVASYEPVDPLALARRLVDVGLWETAAAGFRVHDYLKYQPSAAKVRRDAAKRKKQRAEAARQRWREREATPVQEAMQT